MQIDEPITSEALSIAADAFLERGEQRIDCVEFIGANDARAVFNHAPVNMFAGIPLELATVCINAWPRQCIVSAKRDPRHRDIVNIETLELGVLLVIPTFNGGTSIPCFCDSCLRGDTQSSEVAGL